MSDILTLHNIIVGAVAVIPIRFFVWQFWTLPRRRETIRKIVREEMGMSRQLVQP